MKIGIQTWGSNGDIRPMIALAHGLKKAGHDVTLAINSIDNKRYEEQCSQYGVSTLPAPEQIRFDMENFAQQTFRMNTAQWLVALLDTAFFPYERQIYRMSKQLAVENDLLIGHHFLYPLKIAALKRHKPFYSITFCHGVIPVRSSPPFRFPNLGPLINPFQWKIMDLAFNVILKKKLTALWLKEGLQPIKSVISDLLTSNTLNIVAVDPALCQNHAEWETHHRPCGFLNLPTSSDHWTANQELRRFLESGPAPIYMTFGSLQQAVPDWSMELFIEASKAAGCRAIIQTSSNRYRENTQINDIFFIGQHPHQHLFPKCAAIIHHGGAGTTHSASLCGRPSIVIPFMDEQLFWARTLEKLGLAPEPLPAKHATPHQLAANISTVLADNRFSNQALAVGQQISATDGVRNAVSLIEQTFGRNQFAESR